MRVQESFSKGQQGSLYLCSTPIGNLQDVTLRLLSTLREADIIACEDTRQTRKLLTHFEITAKRLVSYHQYNEAARQKDLVEWWNQGYQVALASDAGTPAISDPGYAAVRLAIEMGVPVIPIPGASATLAALTASGIVPQPFLFLGFLPRTAGERSTVLKKYAAVDSTLLIYESPHRLLSTLSALAVEYIDRDITLARELTKKHESFIRGNLTDITQYVQAEGGRGEFVIVVGPPRRETADVNKPVNMDKTAAQTQEEALRRVRERMEQGLSHREAVSQTALELNLKRRDLYQATLEARRQE